MRLWSLHPRYLDAKGLTAVWREGLLARKVLLGETRGYRSHPQLERFRSGGDPVALVESYLRAVWDEAAERGYRFDRGKISHAAAGGKLWVTRGQLAYERDHLLNKLSARDPDRFELLSTEPIPVAHPLFIAVAGEVGSWERRSRS